MKPEAGDARTSPGWLGLTNRVLDGALSRARWVYWPAWALVRLPTTLGLGLRLLANEYRKGSFGACGRGVRIHGRFEVSAPGRLYVGDNVHINRNALIRAEGGVHIGDNTHIARNLVIYSMNHDFQGARLPYDEHQVLKPVHIGRNCWLGINVSIAPGARIGDGAIIAMGTVVSGEVPAGAIVGMHPQRVIRQRDMDHYRALDEAGCYGGMSGHPYRVSRNAADAPRRTPASPG